MRCIPFCWQHNLLAKRDPSGIGMHFQWIFVWRARNYSSVDLWKLHQRFRCEIEHFSLVGITVKSIIDGKISKCCEFDCRTRGFFPHTMGKKKYNRSAKMGTVRETCWHCRAKLARNTSFDPFDCQTKRSESNQIESHSHWNKSNGNSSSTSIDNKITSTTFVWRVNWISAQSHKPVNSQSQFHLPCNIWRERDCDDQINRVHT